ncbi:MAG: hypothetical protein MUO58_16150 [Anaerolineales bacterium]|nr:hypothetical protein [Anaerolineales bacterium]
MRSTPNSISDSAASASYLPAPWAGRGYDFLTESAKGYPASDRGINRYQIAYKTRSDISEVEDFVPSARIYEPQEILDDALLVFVTEGLYTESPNVSDLEWLLVEVTDMSASRMQFPQVSLTGVLWVHRDKLPVGWWAATGYGLATRSEEIADIEVQGEGTALLKDVSAHLREQMEEWGIQDQVYAALDTMRDTYRSLQGAELSLSTDPEIPERQRIRVTLTVSGTPEEVFEDELCFREWMCSELDTKAGELITITYEWE